MSLRSVLLISSVSSKESEVPLSSLEGKIVGLYFSALWCGPCKQYTPKLVAKYKELLAAGHQLEIIFVSSDTDEESALKYFEQMPWTMVPFVDRETEARLKESFNVNSIPTLVLLDSDGTMLKSDATEIIMSANANLDIKAAIAAEALAADEVDRQIAAVRRSLDVTSFFTSKQNGVVNKQNQILSAPDFAGKTIGLYFSAHWCGPCRRLTPQITEVYDRYMREGKAFEIIFISSDRSEDEALEYFSEMPWTMLSFPARETMRILRAAYEVSSIPCLVLVDEEGQLISKHGTDLIFDYPFERFARCSRK